MVSARRCRPPPMRNLRVSSTMGAAISVTTPMIWKQSMKSQQLGLRLQLVIGPPVRRAQCIRMREAMRLKIRGHLLHLLLQPG